MSRCPLPVRGRDIYARSGVSRHAKAPPVVLGGEGSGRVLTVGDGLSGLLRTADAGRP